MDDTAAGTSTMLAPLGDWTDGGELEIPTLGLKIPLPPGSATLFLPYAFPYRVTRHSGGRRVCVMLRTLKGEQKLRMMNRERL